MSVECSECEWDARSGHDPFCSRSPEAKVIRLEAELTVARQRIAELESALKDIQQWKIDYEEQIRDRVANIRRLAQSIEFWSLTQP